MASRSMAAAMVAGIHKGADVCEAIALKRHLSVPAGPQPRDNVVAEAVATDFARNENAWAFKLCRVPFFF